MTIIKNLVGTIVGIAIGMVLATIGFVALVSDHYRTLEKEARKELERIKHPSAKPSPKTKLVSTETKDTYRIEPQPPKYEWDTPNKQNLPKY